MWCGVNRITTSGRVAGENQKVSREGALRAITIEAAYSLRLENEIGSIESGKLANFTILEENPLTCDPLKIKDIKVWGTVHEGNWLPVDSEPTTTAKVSPRRSVSPATALSAKQRAEKIFTRRTPPSDTLCKSAACTCQIGKLLAATIFSNP